MEISIGSLLLHSIDENGSKAVVETNNDLFIRKRIQIDQIRSTLKADDGNHEIVNVKSDSMKEATSTREGIPVLSFPSVKVDCEGELLNSKHLCFDVRCSDRLPLINFLI